MTIVRRYFIACMSFLFLGVVCSTRSIAATRPSNAVTLNISVHSPIKAGEPIVLSVSITNNTKKLLTLAYMPQFSSFGIEVEDIAGNVPVETSKGCHMHRSQKCVSDVSGFVGSVQSLDIRAGKSVTIPLSVSDEYSLTPGQYHIKLSQKGFRLLDVATDVDLFALGNPTSKDVPKVESNMVDLDVLPN